MQDAFTRNLQGPSFLVLNAMVCLSLMASAVVDLTVEFYRWAWLSSIALAKLIYGVLNRLLSVSVLQCKTEKKQRYFLCWRADRSQKHCQVKSIVLLLLNTVT